MCTLIAIHGCIPGVPLVVAANRDEYLDRPSSGPAVRWEQKGPILAPRDERAGGTWLGLNGSGVFAALTNLRDTDPDPARRSRGEVVIEALAGSGAREAAGRLGQLEVDVYNPFNCFVADAQHAFLVVYRGAPRIQDLTRGVHVIGNVDSHAGVVPKIGRVLGHARKAAALPRERVLPALAGACREHGSGDSPLDDTCVHAGSTYGTRSSMLLELPEPWSDGRMLWADGPPCTERYEDYSSLLHELRQASGNGVAETMARTAS